MCGKSALGGVVLATTMWDTIPPQDIRKAVKRHEELQDKVCHDIREYGGKIVALSAAEIDVLKILQHIVQLNKRLTLHFQQEIMVENMLIHETKVGGILLDTSTCVFDSLQATTDASQRLMIDLVTAGQLRDTEDAYEAVQEMTDNTRISTEGLELTQVALADIRKKWEKNLIQDDAALNEALNNVEKRSVQRTLDLPPKQETHLSLGVGGRPLSELQPPTYERRPKTHGIPAEPDDLMRERKAITIAMATRLNKRHTTYKGISPNISIIGTGLAIGQLVATMACTVM